MDKNKRFMEKYMGKYRIPSARAPWKNYADAGTYFVNINTKNRGHFFGQIQNGIMCLSEIGAIAYNEWLKTLALRPDMNLTLHAHIVMPDHFHAVLSIGTNRYNTKMKNLGKDALQCVSPTTDALQCVSPSTDTNDSQPMTDPNHDDAVTGTDYDDDLDTDALQCVSTPIPPRIPTSSPPATFGPQRKNLSAIMRGYKSTVTVQSRKINPAFGWQTRFYDIIVPDQRALNNIIKYINQNPKKWTLKTNKRTSKVKTHK